MHISTLVTLLSTLFIYMLIGVIMKKSGMVPKSAQSVLTDMVIYCFLPCNLALSFRNDMQPELFREMILAFIAAFGVQAISWTLSRFLYNQYPDLRKKVLQYGTVVSNAGFVGLPICDSVFGATGLVIASIAIIPQRVIMWSAGISLFTDAPDRKTMIRKIGLHPCMCAVYVGLFLGLVNPTLPEFAEKTISSLSACSTPLSMILVGLIIADVEDVRTIISWDVIRYSVIRLVIIPAISLLFCKLFGLDRVVTGVTVLLAGMPAGTMTSILSSKYGGDSEMGSKMVILSTALTFISLPIWCMIL